MSNMGSDGDHCPERRLENDQEHEHELLVLSTNGLNHTFDASRALTTHSKPPGHQVVADETKSRFRFLPIATFSIVVLSLIVCYIIAGSLNHVHWDFPYISHTAIEAPERCIFAQMINIGAVMLAANVYLKFLQMKVFLKKINAPATDNRINRAAEVTGFLSAFGLSLVANFQTQDVPYVHYPGAFIAFVFGTVYCCLHTTLSLRNTNRKKTTCIQFIISILLTISVIIFIVSKAVYKAKDLLGHGTKHDTLRDVYLVSTSSEWMTAILMITFVLTFYKDFSNISFKLPCVEIRNEDLMKQRYRSRPQQTNVNMSV